MLIKSDHATELGTLIESDQATELGTLARIASSSFLLFDMQNIPL
jgi:hypothetical protein